jgi:hypothetical protein
MRPLRICEPLAQAAEPPRVGDTLSLFDEMTLIELECPECTEPLPRGNHSQIIPCTACGQFWRVGREGLTPFPARYARPQGTPQGPILWLPFWRIEAAVRYGGREARQVKDLRNQLGVMRPRAELPTAPPDAPLCYYVPAFGAARAPRLDYAARDMTRLQPVLEAGEQGEGELFTCFYSPEDALRLAYVTWIPILPGVVIPRLRSLRVETGTPALWYVPFDDRGRELSNLLTGFRYDRSTFRGVRH